jgi:hypothetical protein
MFNKQNTLVFPANSFHRREAPLCFSEKRNAITVIAHALFSSHNLLEWLENENTRRGLGYMSDKRPPLSQERMRSCT